MDRNKRDRPRYTLGRANYVAVFHIFASLEVRFDIAVRDGSHGDYVCRGPYDGDGAPSSGRLRGAAALPL